MGNYDRKKSAPCTGFMNCLKWVPVLFIAAVIIWSYYAYIVQLCIFAIDNIFERTIFIIFYHIIFILFIWAYWSTIFTPRGIVPANWRISDADVERLAAESPENSKRILEHCARGLPITNRAPNGSVRYCEKCKVIKPDRAHHCSVCGTCVLKMDHHCPWVNNCVNFTNYKFFVLFLGYALLYCLYVALTSLEYFIRFCRGEFNGGMGRFHILFLFFVSLMFAISLVSLFGYHIYLVLMNRTTLEAFRAPIFRIGGPDKNGFNLGRYANFQEVFGDDWKRWFLPVYTSLGDGLQYPLNPEKHQLHMSSTYESMGNTETSHLQQLQQSHQQQQHQNNQYRQQAGHDDGHLEASAATEISFTRSSPHNGNVVIDMKNARATNSTCDATTSPMDNDNAIRIDIDNEKANHYTAKT